MELLVGGLNVVPFGRVGERSVEGSPSTENRHRLVQTPPDSLAENLADEQAVGGFAGAQRTR